MARKKKKSAMTGSERIAAHRGRLKESGWRSVTVLLPPDAIANLDKLTKQNEQTKGQAIADLLIKASK